jgi:hypothetical protein
MRECPFCAHDDPYMIVIQCEPRVLAIACPECGAVGPSSTGGEVDGAIVAWNQRAGTLWRGFN